MSSILAISTAFLLVACVATPPSIRTNERPVILDHPSVLAVPEHDPETSDRMFLDAVQDHEVFGYCLPIGNHGIEERPVLCLVTELGSVYAIVDHSQEGEAASLYEIGPAVRKSDTRYYLPMLDANLTFERK